jgi:acyl carrier protein
MTELQQRLVRCFTLAFPDLRETEVSSASVASVASWDSTATLVLACVIEEEFGVPVSYEDLPELVSFELILDYLEHRLHGVS